MVWDGVVWWLARTSRDGPTVVWRWVWYGEVCYGVVWYGEVWYGMVWYGGWPGLKRWANSGLEVGMVG